MTTTTQSADSVPDHDEDQPDAVTGRARKWLSETLYGTVAGAAGLAVIYVALLSGMQKPVSYTIVGLVCLWLATIGADRAIKHRRASR